MGQLRDDHGPVTGAVGLGRLVPGSADHGCKGVLAPLVQPQLPWIGPGLLYDGDGLGPDQPRAAAGESLVAANGELVRPAPRVAVTAFHRVHGQRVGNGQTREIDRLGQDGDIFNRIDGDAELLSQAFEVLNAAQLEFPLPGLCG